jgi:hypothetical protein
MFEVSREFEAGAAELEAQVDKIDCPSTEEQ